MRFLQDDAVVAKIVCPEGTADLPIGALLAYTVDDLDTYKSLLDSGALANLPTEDQASNVEIAVPVAAKKEEEREETGRSPLIKFLGKRTLLPEFNDSPIKEFEKSVDAAQPETAVPVVSHTNDADAEFKDLPLSNMRKVIAKRLSASKRDVPHSYTSINCEIDNILKFRKQLSIKHDVKTQSVQRNSSVDISVAVAAPSGLITPIVPKVETLGLSGVNRVFMELVSRARLNKLKPEEFQGGSFTVSNLGSFGIEQFRAVINPPQACILAIGGGRREVLPPLEIVEGVNPKPRIATLMNVTLSSDRRVVDGVIAGQFLQVFKSYMESPELMVL
ncbi:unnamed protein product [Peronospora belbahrii]|uniref:2-oxoacid dehydrogenase acyltransferase catalytic domain-containing protein n=1 Tax=Peronospora belbahrii TaxID=622444 RepID=A0ABN8D3Q1_9STRA|nr:unnamed protein product [Peronospora belbahrii]